MTGAFWCPAGRGEGSRVLARVATPVGGAPRGAVASMAAPSGVPPLRVLEELGIGLSPTGEVTEAVTSEGAYYLERILLVASRAGW